MNNYFRVLSFLLFFVLAAGCSKKASVEAQTPETPPPSPAATSGSEEKTGSGPAADKDKADDKEALVLRAFAWSNGERELKPGDTVDLPYRGSIVFTPTPPSLDQVSVKSGPFTPVLTQEGVVVKFDPTDAELTELEKGKRVKAVITVFGATLELDVGLLKS